MVPEIMLITQSRHGKPFYDDDDTRWSQCKLEGEDHSVVLGLQAAAMSPKRRTDGRMVSVNSSMSWSGV